MSGAGFQWQCVSTDDHRNPTSSWAADCGSKYLIKEHSLRAILQSLLNCMLTLAMQLVWGNPTRPLVTLNCVLKIAISIFTALYSRLTVKFQLIYSSYDRDGL